MSRVVWGSRMLAITMTGAVVAFFVRTEADQTWKYFAYPLLAALPLAYGLVSARYIRLLHVTLLRRYQAQLMMRTAELQEIAARDELTHLYNRRYFYDCLQAELTESRASKRALAILVLDIDGLKTINDEYGHRVGDETIANLAKVVSKHIRTTDVAARLGGDEFGVIMPGTDKRGAFSLAQRLWEDLEETPMYEDGNTRVMVNISIGVSGFPWGGEDMDEMVHWADADMYANKVSRRLAAEVVSSGDADQEAASPADKFEF